MFNFFSKLKKNDRELVKSSDKIKSGLFSIFNGKKLDQDIIDGLEELLITSDIGTVITSDIISLLSVNRFGKEITISDIKNLIYDRLIQSFNGVKNNFIEFGGKKPYVMLFLGVNGCGKTTIIGKLAHQMKNSGKSVLLAACDTFRAGAVEQLKIWKDKAKVDIISAEKLNEDPSSLAYRAFKKAMDENYDVLLIDTAGRLQNNVNLMAELKKIENTLKKLDSDVPNKNILVLDATTGQNSLKQFEEFQKFVSVDGIIMNKMDGTSKGGILVNIVEKFKKPIYALGIGEKIGDIRDFTADEFLKNLLGIE